MRDASFEKSDYFADYGWARDVAMVRPAAATEPARESDSLRHAVDGFLKDVRAA